MINEKKIIKNSENRIDTYIKEYPEKKNCEYVETQREFIHILQIEAREQEKRKEYQSTR